MRVCITVFLDVVHETAATVDISLSKVIENLSDAEYALIKLR